MLSAYRLSRIIILPRSCVHSDVLQSVRASSDFNSFMRLSSKPALARYSAAMRLSASLIRSLPEKSYKISKQHVSAACLSLRRERGKQQTRKEDKEVLHSVENAQRSRPRQWKGKRKRDIGATNDLSITFPQYHFTTDYGVKNPTFVPLF